MSKHETIGAKIEAAWRWPEHLDALAAKWSEETGRVITRSDVVRTLLADGLEAHPVDESDLARAKAKKAPKQTGSAQTLSIVRLEGNQAVGFDRLIAMTEASEEEKRPQGDLNPRRAWFRRPHPDLRDSVATLDFGSNSQSAIRRTRRAA